VIQFPKFGGDGQKWRFEYDQEFSEAGGGWKVRNKRSSLVLDVRGNHYDKKGSPVIQYPDGGAGAANQIWLLVV
jgi:Ricin-type beta-trefoil lectin domain-like